MEDSGVCILTSDYAWDFWQSIFFVTGVDWESAGEVVENPQGFVRHKRSSNFICSGDECRVKRALYITLQDSVFFHNHPPFPLSPYQRPQSPPLPPRPPLTSSPSSPPATASTPPYPSSSPATPPPNPRLCPASESCGNAHGPPPGAPRAHCSAAR